MVKITAIPGHFTIDDLAQGIKVSIEYSPVPYCGKNYRVNICGRYTTFPNLNACARRHCRQPHFFDSFYLSSYASFKKVNTSITYYENSGFGATSTPGERSEF